MTYLWAYLVAFVRLFVIVGVSYFVAYTLMDMDLRPLIGLLWYIVVTAALAGPIGVWIDKGAK
jgi:hypothetical protein